jgi:hypothetical protein
LDLHEVVKSGAGFDGDFLGGVTFIEGIVKVEGYF